MLSVHLCCSMWQNFPFFEAWIIFDFMCMPHLSHLLYPFIFYFIIILCIILLYIFYPHPRAFFHGFLERKEGREAGGERESVRTRTRREKHQRERTINKLPSWTHPDGGLNLKPGNVPWPGIEPVTFWSMGWCSNQLRHIGQDRIFFNSLSRIRFLRAVQLVS